MTPELPETAELKIEVIARIATPGKDQPSVFPLGEATGATMAELSDNLRVLFAEMPVVLDAVLNKQGASGDVDQALARADGRWNTRTSGTDSSQAFRDRATLAVEIVRLRTLLAATNSSSGLQ